MKAVKIFFMLMQVMPAFSLYSQQRETFDMVSHAIPEGWAKEIQDLRVSYSITDKTTGDWCVITVYKSIAGSGNLATDFESEWNVLVTKAYPNTALPTPVLVTQGGWSVQSGAGNFTWQNRQSVILLNVISGYGRVTSITVTTNTKAYQEEAQQFLDSIEMQKTGNDSSVTPEQITQTPVSHNVGSTGITKSTTTFTDGWVAQAMDDYVLVTKENTKLYIHYGFPIPSNVSSSESGTTKENWEKLITPRYTVTNLWLNPDVGSWGGSFNYYAEGTAIEKSTGKQVYIGFRTIIDGAYFCVEAVAPTKEEYLKHFPTLAMLKDMRNSNRFAVTTADVIGDWSSSSGSALQYYNVYTGQNAGMQFSQGGQEFFFKNNGEYNANISGAMGNMGGAQVVFDNKYNGKFSTTDWEITMTNYGGVTQVFTAYFEALKGGRILHIAKKDAPGVHYPLVKVK